MKLYHLSDYCSDRLPLAVWPVQNAGAIMLHRHDCIELALITRGSGVCRINDIPYPVLRGDLYVLNPHDTHSYEMASSCKFYNILFDRELMQNEPVAATLLDRWESASAYKLYQFANGEIEAESRRFGEIADELKHRRPGYELMVRSLFAAFLVKLLRMDQSARGPAAHHEENASRVLEYIQSNLERIITRKELAKVAGMSPPALGKAFRQWTGSTVNDYIGNLRIRKAKLLLEEQVFSIGEIALKLGFYDSCHFARIFRRRTGISPRRFRLMVAASASKSPGSPH